MSVDSIKVPVSASPSMIDSSAMVSQSAMWIRLIGTMQSFCSLFIIVGLIVGIIYMIKSQKTKGKKILIGAIIIGVPVILHFILNIVKFTMLLNM